MMFKKLKHVSTNTSLSEKSKHASASTCQSSNEYNIKHKTSLNLSRNLWTKSFNTISNLKETTKEIPEETIKEIPEETTKEIPVEATKEIPEETTEKSPEESATKEIPEETIKEIPEQTATKEILKEATKEILEETAKEIPEEAIKEIMVLLPVKSLLKFRSVQHSWLSFIDSPYCVKTHLSKSNPKIIINGPHGLFVLDIAPKNTTLKPETSVLKQCYLNSDTFGNEECPNITTVLLGSCNGLILSYHYKSAYTCLKDSMDCVLQNPYTRTFQTIPFLDPTWPGPQNILTVPEKFVFALWYDDSGDDYKVFRNCQFYGCMEYPFFSQVNVYSLKMQSYKEMSPFPYYMKNERDETVFAGGALHWVVSSAPWDNSQWIASFDVSTEEYKLVEKPAYSGADFKLTLHVLGGCLSVGCSYTPLDHKEVWVMKEYGNVDSWSRIVCFTGPIIDAYLKPLLFSECGKKMLIERDCRALLWCDLEKNTGTDVELDTIHGELQFQSFVHLESLVKLSCRVDEKSDMQDNDENPNNMDKKKRDDFLSKGFKLEF